MGIIWSTNIPGRLPEQSEPAMLSTTTNDAAMRRVEDSDTPLISISSGADANQSQGHGGVSNTLLAPHSDLPGRCSDHSRSLPSEILGLIFKELISNLEGMKKLCVGLTISHVCARWRAVALDSPSLWNELIYNLKHSTATLEHYSTSVIPRLRNQPAHISFVNAINTLGESTHREGLGYKLRSCHMEQLSNVERLILRYLGSCQLPAALDRIPAGVQTVAIHGYEEVDRLFNPDFAYVVVGTSFLRQLSTLQRLILHGATFDLEYRSLPTISSLTSVTLNCAKVPSMKDFFHMCPNLQSLAIRACNISCIQGQLAPNLQHLTIDDSLSYGDPPYLTTPRLRHLVLTATSEVPDSIGWVGSNPSLKVLDIPSSRGESIPLLQSAPQLERLSVGPNFFRSILAKISEATASQRLLSNLECLCLNHGDLGGSSFLRRSEFDNFVRLRCLPERHPDSQLPGGLQLLPRLVIQGGIPGTWMFSKHVQEATFKKDGYTFMELSWSTTEWTHNSIRSLTSSLESAETFLCNPIDTLVPS